MVEKTAALCYNVVAEKMKKAALRNLLIQRGIRYESDKKRRTGS